MHVQRDRRLAIKEALAAAGASDIVLIAGKGHETYQEINGVKAPFDDRAVAAECRRWRHEAGHALAVGSLVRRPPDRRRHLIERISTDSREDAADTACSWR